MAPTLKCSAWIFLHQFLAITLSAAGDCLSMLAEAEVAKANAPTTTLLEDSVLLETGTTWLNTQPKAVAAQSASASAHHDDKPDARKVLSWVVPLSMLMMGFIGFVHKNPHAEDEKNPKQGTFIFIDSIQKFLVFLSAAIAFCCQFADRDHLSDINMLIVMSCSSLVVVAVSYSDECVANTQTKEDLIAEIES